jgi:hypothetical protein
MRSPRSSKRLSTSSRRLPGSSDCPSSSETTLPTAAEGTAVLVLISRFDIIASLPVVSLLQVRTSHGHSDELDHESLNPVIPAPDPV